jgi:uncharacterized protein (TIGR02246 family)
VISIPTTTTLSALHFAKWEAALLTRDPEQVALLYADNATLLPTMAENVITDREGVVAYFTFFETFLPTVRMVEEHVTEVTDKSYLHCGVYRFTLTIEGREEMVDARFTMLWQKIHDEWKILHHHSSRVPKR